VAVGGGVFRLIQPLPGPTDPRRPDPAYVAVAGGLGLGIVVVTALALVRSVRTRPGGVAAAEPIYSPEGQMRGPRNSEG
jgi:hypothetical protein